MIVKNGGNLFGYAMMRNNNVLTAGKAIWNDGANTLVNFTTVTNYTKSTTENKIEQNTNVGVTMYLGVGTTPPTVNDYWLDQTEVNGVDINDDILLRSGTVGEGANGSSLYTFAFMNMSDKTYTVKEICLAVVPISTTTDPRNGRCIMIARKLIVPRTVQPSETITFTYEISPCGGT